MHDICINFKMKWQKMIPILLSACLSIAGCKEVKDPEFRRIDNFGVRSISLQDATIGFDVTYFNPNNFGVNVKEAAADVYIDSLYLGKFTQVQSVNVRQEADFSIPFSGKVSFQ